MSLALLLALIVWYVFWMRARVPDVGVSFFGAAYCGMLLSGIIVVRTALPEPWGGVLVLGIFLSVWANDSFAYLVGSKFGKHKLAPRTSPKKSWEGFFAGLAGSAVFWCLMTLVPGVTMSIPQAILFGLASGLMGVLGDLAESRIKRNSGFKDSGTIMPGHGGLLDRCDSLFLVAVTSAILLVGGGCIPYGSAGLTNGGDGRAALVDFGAITGRTSRRAARSTWRAVHGVHRHADARRGRRHPDRQVVAARPRGAERAAGRRRAVRVAAPGGGRRDG